uniref:Uncharacterized protein n=1 Tax=Glossina palpalis gambiensis TaxID=67801 RepID=A0A1B0AWV5_9MUSC
MHFNKINNNSNKSNNDSLTSSSLSSSSVVAVGDDSVSPYFTAATVSSSASWFHGMNANLCWLFLLALLFMAHQQPCECRYLPTRSHADDLDKLRELMLQTKGSVDIKFDILRATNVLAKIVSEVPDLRNSHHLP